MKAMLAALAVSMLAPMALATDTDVKGQCHDEAKRICPGMKMGEGLGKCLRQHKDEFSKECRDLAAEKKKMFKEAVDACKSDAETLCKDVQRGGGRVVKCLKSHIDKVSPGCKEHLEKH